ncbi:DUF397 domain-containing protein [Streptomyces sp. CB01881]|nr:DUF397 domain-containing protein [Streptomyces sp. CB01881]TYC72042.1 DUF397 domain-containing protein [Streptomyces sp. CB01881]
MWRKSSRSNDSADCVEFATPGGAVTYVRDSKDASGPALALTASAHAAFIAAVANGEFDFDLL